MAKADYKYFREPKNVFLEGGTCKLRESLASALGTSGSKLIFKVLYNTFSSLQLSDIYKLHSQTGPNIVLIADRFLPRFTRIGLGPPGTSHIDTEAFLFTYEPGLASASHGTLTKHVAKHVLQRSHITWQDHGPCFSTDLTVTKEAVTSAAASFEISPEFSQNANITGLYNLEVLAVWNSNWGALTGIGHWHGGWQNTLTADAWLPGVAWGEKECARLMSALISFKPPRELPKVNILLVGGAGAGKSSFISSVDSVFKWRISRRAPHGQATSSFTRLLTQYTFRSRAQHLIIKGELGNILDGNICSGTDITQPHLPGRPDFRQCPELADKMHKVLLVVLSEEGSNSDYMAKLRSMKAYCIARGITTLMLLIKVDEYDPDHLLKDITRIFHSRSIEALVSGRLLSLHAAKSLVSVMAAGMPCN